MKKTKTFDEQLIEAINNKVKNLKVGVEFENQKEFLASAHRIFEEKAFGLVLGKLTERQLEHSVKEAEDWQRVLFDRATINGFGLIKEEFELLNAQFKDMIKEPETFNKQDIL